MKMNRIKDGLIHDSQTNQAEEAYNFVLRHINKGVVVEAVYTVSSWEYPVKAIREAIRNAVVHRDYSLTGKDVKVAVYDAMESRQSDAHNKIIAPVFKRMGIIGQWGNGLKPNGAVDYHNTTPNKNDWEQVGTK